MSQPDLLDLYNECLRIVEETTDDRTAERMVLIAARIFQMADEDFARHCANIEPLVATPAPFGGLRGSAHKMRRPGPTSPDGPVEHGEFGATLGARAAGGGCSAVRYRTDRSISWPYRK
jgi:hypothetical protein